MTRARSVVEAKGLVHEERHTSSHDGTVDCRATSDRTTQASTLARVGRPPALDFRRRAVVVAQTGPCLHQRWARCGHMASEQNIPFNRAKSAANSAKMSG